MLTLKKYHFCFFVIQNRNKPTKYVFSSLYSTPTSSQTTHFDLRASSNTTIDVDPLRLMPFITLALLAGLITMAVLLKLWNIRRCKTPASCKLTKATLAAILYKTVHDT